MKNVASKPWTLAAVVVTTMVCLAAFALVSVPVVEAQQSGASEEEIAARVRAELEARLAQVNQRILEQMRQLEAMREVDVEKLQQELQMLTENGARFRELAELSAQRAAELHSQTSEETRRRTGELTRRAMEQAEQAVRRAGRVSTLRMRGGCNAFGDTVLELSEDLGLSDDQVTQIREAQRTARRDRIERNADVEIGEMDLEALYEADQPDLTSIRAKLEELAILGVDNQMAGLSLAQQVRGILTPQQLEQFEDLRGDDDFRVIISGVGSSWSVGRIGC
jgi:exonuclease VII large subunit